eukprot:1064907-Rhodomonas_salina.4
MASRCSDDASTIEIARSAPSWYKKQRSAIPTRQYQTGSGRYQTGERGTEQDRSQYRTCAARVAA